MLIYIMLLFITRLKTLYGRSQSKKAVIRATSRDAKNGTRKTTAHRNGQAIAV